MFPFLERLDHYALLTPLSTLALQFQFFRYAGYFSEPGLEKSNLDSYFFFSGLMFFSMVFIYNSDHLGDKIRVRDLFRWIHLKPGSIPYLLSMTLSTVGIFLWLLMGWELWDVTFLGLGIGVFTICVIHLFIFHSRWHRLLYPFKEISVSSITVIAILCPLIYLDLFQ